MEVGDNVPGGNRGRSGEFLWSEGLSDWTQAVEHPNRRVHVIDDAIGSLHHTVNYCFSDFRALTDRIMRTHPMSLHEIRIFIGISTNAFQPGITCISSLRSDGTCGAIHVRAVIKNPPFFS